MTDDPGTPQQEAPSQSSEGTPSQEERLMAALAHGLAIVLGFIPPLVIFLVKGDESEFVKDQSKEALNFQITVTIALLVCSGLTVVFIGCLLLPVVAIGDLVLCLIAALKAYEGTRYRYPWTLRLID